MKPKKLIRKSIVYKLKEGEWEIINNQHELNNLYHIKIREELEEIKESNHKDIMEFADLLEVVYCFAQENGFDRNVLDRAAFEKFEEKGSFGRLALTNLNPENPSNKLYFVDENNELNTYKKALEKISIYGAKPIGETYWQRIKRLKAIADKALFFFNDATKVISCSGECGICDDSCKIIKC